MHIPDPLQLLDDHMYAEEVRYERMIQNATCGDCANCQEPDGGWTGKRPMFSDPDVGYCLCGECFTHLSDMPKQLECYDYEPR